ncbi:MAG TPA: M20/M25/M40 family metallo-hydrolase [Methanomassiliicoccales archaeon]|nr:M20/M25/M40 family metallo-hydrolase [Methanomassiliicoccales archaeon]
MTRTGRKAAASVVKTLIELLRRPSDYKDDKRRVVSFARGWLEDLGMDVTIHGQKTMPAICATNGEGGVILSGHLDTVPLGDMWTKEQGEVEGGKIYGRGAADMKGAVASMLHASAELMKEDAVFSVFLTTDEEEKMTGAFALSELDLLWKAKGVVIGEPTDLLPAYKEKGISRFQLTTHGTAAHASQPWLGDNAISKMSRLLDKLAKLPSVPEIQSDDLTICVSMIKGGTKFNVVPDHCQVEIDARFPTPLTYRKVRTIIMDQLMGEDYDIQMIYELEAYEADQDSELSQSMKELTGNELIVVPYATEAPVYAAQNPNVIVCGPGGLNMAHVDDEYVERFKLERATGLYADIVRKLA